MSHSNEVASIASSVHCCCVLSPFTKALRWGLSIGEPLTKLRAEKISGLSGVLNRGIREDVRENVNRV